MEEIILYFHTDCLLKKNGTNHPERKERLEVVLKTIKKIENIKITIKNAPLVGLASPVSTLLRREANLLFRRMGKFKGSWPLSFLV